MTTSQYIIAICSLLELILIPVIVVGVVMLIREWVKLERSMRQLDRLLNK